MGSLPAMFFILTRVKYLILTNKEMCIRDRRETDRQTETERVRGRDRETERDTHTERQTERGVSVRCPQCFSHNTIISLRLPTLESINSKLFF